jgi:hypothetical protein
LKDSIYVPYWRFKGMAFFCRTNQIGHKLIDLSYLASHHTFLPHSLGVRPQVLKLKFVSPELEGRFFSPSVPLKTVMEAIERQLHSVGSDALADPVFLKALVGDTASLIYFPIVIKGNMFHEGILGKPIAEIPEAFVDDLLSFHQQPGLGVKFVSTLCPHCGWDLLGERDSVALFCKNCESAWEVSQMLLEKVDFGVMPSQEAPSTYLPFWVMKTRIEELNIRSYADLIRVANVPRAMKKEWDDLDLNFWAPAFKVPPQIFLGLTKCMTISQPREPFEPSLPKASLYPVTLPVREAMESIKVTLADIAIDKQRILPRLSKIDVELDKFLLVHLPFHFNGSEFIHSQTQSCIHKNYLKLGRNL